MRKKPFERVEALMTGDLDDRRSDHTAVGALRAARARIADEAHWQSAVAAVDANGAPVESDDEDAVAWNSHGALLSVYERLSTRVYFEAVVYLNRAALAVSRWSVMHAVDFNLGHAKVLEMYDVAIDMAERGDEVWITAA